MYTKAHISGGHVANYDFISKKIVKKTKNFIVFCWK